VRCAILASLMMCNACAGADALNLSLDEAADAGIDPMFTPRPPSHLDGGLSYPTDPLSFAERGEWDAGFVLNPTPPPVDGDPCAAVCLGSSCAPRCRLQCRHMLMLTPPDERASTLACVAEDTCHALNCRSDQTITQAICDAVCAGACSPFSRSLNCADRCATALTLMAPVARQGYLDCVLNDCPSNPDVDCQPADFFGPRPTASCLSFAVDQQRCGGERRTNTWQEVWACESWRSPSDQDHRLAGNHIVDCLGASAVCGYAGFFTCVAQGLRSTDPTEEQVAACAQAQTCEDPELFGRCTYLLSGLSTLIGETRLTDTTACLVAAGTACSSIDACLEALVDPLLTSPDCVAGCLRCGEVGDSCVHQCSALRGSLSTAQSATFSTCLAEAPCDGALTRKCAATALAAASDACDSFEAQVQRCAEVPQRPLPGAHFLCTVSGIRTGLLNRQELNACVVRLGCAAGPLSSCLRGAPMGTQQ
jgi:hypothetical protein